MRFFLFILALSASILFGQDIPSPLPPENIVAPEDEARLNRMALDLFAQWDALAKPVGNSVVALVCKGKPVAMGTVVAPGYVLTKLSNLQKERRPVMLMSADGKFYDSKVWGSLPEHDLLLLHAPGLGLPPVSMQNHARLQEGSLIAGVLPGGQVSDFGVVSVPQRSLLSVTQPYLGILSTPQLNKPGVRIVDVARHSSARRAGLRNGDILLALNNTELNASTGLPEILATLQPGDKVPVRVLRDGRILQSEITIGSRPKNRKLPEDRIASMDAWGNRMNKRRDNFPLVIQSDITLSPECTGCPVIDIHGNFAGIALSRAGRTETYILPAELCKELVEELNRQLAQTSQDDAIPDAVPL